MTDDARHTRSTNQSALNFDDSPQRFRDRHPEDGFGGASGVLFEQAMAQTRMAVCLTDPNQPDMPIVFANRAFRTLTGYAEDEIVGHNCRFLQGPETDRATVAKIRQAIAAEDVAIVELLNYRKDGSTFWNALHLGPIYDGDGRLTYFFGSQWDVSDVRAARAEERHARLMARELSHRMKNMFSVISGIVNITGRMRGIEAEAQEINGRIQALGRAYETTLDEASTGSIELGQAIRAILAPYDQGDGRLQLLGNGLRAPFQTVSTVGLLLHELAANAGRHGAWTRQDGRVAVDWRERGGEVVVSWRESGGPGAARPGAIGGAGHAIMDRLVRTAGGGIERRWEDEGLHAEVRMPLGTGA